jgi:hypothetical protein
MNQHQINTLFLVCLLGVNASTCFGRYAPIFRRFCTNAIWCNYVRRMCVDYVQVAVEPQPALVSETPTPNLVQRTYITRTQYTNCRLCIAS